MPDSSITAMDITLQLAAAFGQGAGQMLIDVDALRPAHAAYAERLQHSIPHWETDALGSIAVLRAMGTYAAHLALSDHRMVISRADVEAALDQVQRMAAHPLTKCQITGRGV
jgi:hypothetical protein